jgi:hypothetical protein
VYTEEQDYAQTHFQVDRVGFSSSRLNWDSPSPAGEYVPSTFGSWEWGTHSLAGEGVGGSQFGRGNRHCGTL